ncbi:HAMP domain-containing histidine kinase [Paenibacillus sp. N4]|uniref:sensor histidine kinase n=1 Tax=Paenibacillus vietnamensis TaxID=2590547 RepID=UPI001CD1222F|nr:HAMP domain-containing sensor histidine kinase [Paenibacillus vietnamensis]MCA0758008.1 HAMP domain-containing histidine kinase [Paenibacillus vietnamensis]
MFVYFTALLTAAVIVLANNRGNEANRWAAYFLAGASVGGLSHVLAGRGFERLPEALQFLNYTFTPCAVLLFCILYTRHPMSRSAKRKIKLALLLPMLLMALLAYAPGTAVPEKTFFIALLSWCAPYYLISCYLLIVSCWREREPAFKRSRIITTVIIVPTLLGVVIFIYAAKVFVPEFEFFRYISVFMAYSLGIAVLCAFIYGVLGVKVRFERDPLEGAMKAVNLGTSLLNHTIKNEIGKIALSADNVKASIAESDVLQQEQLQVIANSSRHLLEMVDRMHSRTKDILLKEEPVRLDLLLEQCVLGHRDRLAGSGIELRTVYRVRPTVICDPIHVKEAVGNLILNAAEAMTAGGSIDAVLDKHKGGVSLAIEDTGPGIPESLLAHVFEPFVSGGKSGRNFGLGLSYVYNVMRRSGGKAELRNRPEGGARASLLWPKAKTMP